MQRSFLLPCAAVGGLLLLSSGVISQESGYQIIQGTRVYTQIDHSSDTATFSNECGTQTLTHAQLGAGAIPSDIIPCPNGNNAKQNGRSDEDRASKLRIALKEVDEGRKEYDSGNYQTASVSFSVALDSIRDLDREKTTEGLRELISKIERYISLSACAEKFVDAKKLVLSKHIDSLTMSFATQYTHAAMLKCQDVRSDLAEWLSKASKGAIAASLALKNGGNQRASCVDPSDPKGPPVTCGSEISMWSVQSPKNNGGMALRLRTNRGKLLDIQPGEGIHRSANGDLRVQNWEAAGSPVAMESEDRCLNSETTTDGWVLLSCQAARYELDQPFASNIANDAYKNYMNSRNLNSGGKNNGDLAPRE